MVDDRLYAETEVIHGIRPVRPISQQPIPNRKPVLSRIYRAAINPNTQLYLSPEVLCSPPESTSQSELDALRLLDTGRFLFIPSAQLSVRAKEIGLPIRITEGKYSISIDLSPDFRDLGQLTGFLSNNKEVGPFVAEAV